MQQRLRIQGGLHPAEGARAIQQHRHRIRALQLVGGIDGLQITDDLGLARARVAAKDADDRPVPALQAQALAQLQAGELAARRIPDHQFLGAAAEW
jgi:hypothetical protein